MRPRSSSATVSLLVLATAASLPFAACRPAEVDQPPADAGCVVGVLLPESGQHEDLGRLVRNGIEVAQRQLEASGIQTRFRYRDTEGTPSVARPHIKELIHDESACTVLGSILTSDSKGFVDELDELRVPVLANGSSAPEMRGVSPWFFRNWPSDDYEGLAMANYAKQELGFTEVVVLYSDDPYPRGIAASFQSEFSRLGGKVLLAESYDEGESVFDAVVRKLLRLKPDALYAVGFGGELGNLLLTLRAVDQQLPVLSAVAIDAPEFFSVAGKAANNIFYTAPAVSEGWLPYLQFKEGYMRLFHERPEIVATITYDAALILGTVAHTAKCDPVEIRARLATLEDFPGAAGVTSFDDHGDVHQPVAIKRIEDQRSFVLERFDFPGPSEEAGL